MDSKNDVATAKQARFQKFQQYVDTVSDEIYIDYRDELSSEQVTKILEGKSDEVYWDICDSYSMDADYSYYFETMAEKLEVTKEEIDEWLAEDGCYPSSHISEYDWKKLLSNTSVEITATVWDAEWNFNNWAYGGPVNYSDVK